MFAVDHAAAALLIKRLAAWKGQSRRTAAHELILSTASGKPISPNNGVAQVGLASLSGSGPGTGDVAHVQANLFLLFTPFPRFADSRLRRTPIDRPLAFVGCA